MGDPASLIEPTLRERLGDITKQRELNGVFNEGTDEIAANVYLIANPELAIGPFAKLFIAAAESAGDIYIPKKTYPRMTAYLGIRIQCFSPLQPRNSIRRH
jgi:hypothetical protein